MLISKRQLVDFGACKDGLKRFIIQTDGTDEMVNVSSLVGGANTYSDLLWLAGKTISKDRIVKFSCDCALINIDMIKSYTDKYDLIVGFLRNPTAADASRAARAAYAAYTAADASDAAYAARAAARAAYAAYAAVDASDAAVDAARAAAYAARAAYAAARAAYTAADASYAAACAAYSAVDASDAGKVNALLIELFNEAG